MTTLPKQVSESLSSFQSALHRHRARYRLDVISATY